MLANAFSFVNPSGPAAGSAGQPPQLLQQTPQTSASMQFSRLLDQQAAQRRDAERSDASKAANRAPPRRTVAQDAPPEDSGAPRDAAGADPRTAAMRQQRPPAGAARAADQGATRARAAAGGSLAGTSAGDTAGAAGSPAGVTDTMASHDAAPSGTAVPQTPQAGGPPAAGLAPVSAAMTTTAGRSQAGPGQEPGATPVDDAGAHRTACRTGTLAATHPRLAPHAPDAPPGGMPPAGPDTGATAAAAGLGGRGDEASAATAAQGFAASLQALLPADAASAASAAGAAGAADKALAGAGAPADVPTAGRLHASPGTPEFAGALGAQLSTFVANGVHHARLELNPAEMGPLTVQIQLDGQNAQVHLAADHADTRQALEQALPQLAGSLRDAGLTLSGGGVFEQPQPRPQPAPDGDGDGTQRGPRATATAPSGAHDGGDPTPRPAAWPARRGVVDLVA